MYVFALSVYPQTEGAPLVAVDTMIVDVPTEVDFRVPHEEAIQKYIDDSRFNYEEDIVNNGPSLLDRFLYWLKNKIGSIFTDHLAFNSGIGVAMLIVLILLIVLVVLKLSGVKLKTLLGKKKLDTPEIEIYSENVHEMDFDQLIAQAISNKDYRLATRFLYLRNLKILTDKDIIKWNPNKTNNSYQYEIADNELRNQFVGTTLIFDYVWYGEFVLDEAMFVSVSEQLEKLSKSILPDEK